ncbi:hypothetical protein CQS04_01890 [Chryseomicrobium excrementi]|uniref:DUF2922 domain-containing protein n=1 Tax=Chryseomicrobium excrementi TaxID=2041346 RepID=A0A2M9F2G9_9BACL|nr:DUF2922 domain-containing protein [Chryseomicrobium excrementi]PJK17652.1 hypothetical protein CQS04_01890 [Chryseomicrobium excrementi]
MAKTLQLEFGNTAGKKITVAVEEPRTDLTLAEVQTAMQAILAAEVFSVEGEPATEAVSAQIIDRSVQSLF